MINVKEIKEEARRLLEEAAVKYVIGYRSGPDPLTAAPFFAVKPEDADRLIWDPTCVQNLVRFVRDEKRRRGRPAWTSALPYRAALGGRHKLHGCHR